MMRVTYLPTPPRGKEVSLTIVMNMMIKIVMIVMIRMMSHLPTGFSKRQASGTFKAVTR